MHVNELSLTVNVCRAPEHSVDFHSLLTFTSSLLERQVARIIGTLYAKS